jgi:hypothetical protein
METYRSSGKIHRYAIKRLQATTPMIRKRLSMVAVDLALALILSVIQSHY